MVTFFTIAHYIYSIRVCSKYHQTIFQERLENGIPVSGQLQKALSIMDAKVCGFFDAWMHCTNANQFEKKMYDL